MSDQYNTPEEDSAAIALFFQQNPELNHSPEVVQLLRENWTYDSELWFPPDDKNAEGMSTTEALLYLRRCECQTQKSPYPSR